jgi:hypothetical protein
MLFLIREEITTRKKFTTYYHDQNNFLCPRIEESSDSIEHGYFHSFCRADSVLDILCEFEKMGIKIDEDFSEAYTHMHFFVPGDFHNIHYEFRIWNVVEGFIADKYPEPKTEKSMLINFPACLWKF